MYSHGGIVAPRGVLILFESGEVGHPASNVLLRTNTLTDNSIAEVGRSLITDDEARISVWQRRGERCPTLDEIEGLTTPPHPRPRFPPSPQKTQHHIPSPPTLSQPAGKKHAKGINPHARHLLSRQRGPRPAMASDASTLPFPSSSSSSLGHGHARQSQQHARTPSRSERYDATVQAARDTLERDGRVGVDQQEWTRTVQSLLRVIDGMVSLAWCP